MKQHRIDRDNPPITDRMTSGALGSSCYELVGRSVVTAYEMSDSDRGESLLLLDNGQVVQISCDPGYADDDVTRTPDRWEVVMYDATETEAGKIIKQLEPGHWL